MTGAPWNQVDPERLKWMVAAGNTAQQIAETFGVTPRTVVRHKKAHGLSQPWHGRRTVPDGWHDRAAALLDEGLSVRAVAEVTKVTKQTVVRYFPGRGWDPHTVGQYAAAVRELNRIHTHSKGTQR